MKSAARRLPWGIYGGLQRAYIYKERKLGVVVSRIDPEEPEFTVVAFETSAKGLEAIFDQHAHAMVGKTDDVIEAVRLAEAYGEDWLANAAAGAPPPADCECDEIDDGDATPTVVGPPSDGVIGDGS